MKRMNFPVRKQKRVEEAVLRQKKYNEKSVKGKLETIKNRTGESKLETLKVKGYKSKFIKKQKRKTKNFKEED